jgi:hypothetical protein
VVAFGTGVGSGKHIATCAEFQLCAILDDLLLINPEFTVEHMEYPKLINEACCNVVA